MFSWWSRGERCAVALQASAVRFGRSTAYQKATHKLNFGIRKHHSV